MHVSVDECAGEVLDVIPHTMRAIRTEMRRHRRSDLSIPQFRTLAMLNQREGASLSDLAEFMGLTLPSASKLVDGLVVRKLVSRKTCAGDRRRLTLTLTSPGRATLEAARVATQAHLAKELEKLPADELAIVIRAMRILRPIFVPCVNKVVGEPSQEATARHRHKTKA